jgi:hypothetical protein
VVLILYVGKLAKSNSAGSDNGILLHHLLARLDLLDEVRDLLKLLFGVGVVVRDLLLEAFDGCVDGAMTAWRAFSCYEALPIMFFTIRCRYGSTFC